MKFLSTCIAVLSSVVLANATLLFSDSFSYPDGAITNVSGGVWSDDSGSPALNVVSGQVQLSGAGQDAYAALSGQPYTTGSGVTLYASFTVNFSAVPTTAGSYFAHFNASSSFKCVVWASINGAASGKFRLGVGNTSGATATTGQIATDLSLNTTYQVVTRYVVGTGQSTIWLNPSAESDPSVTAGDSASAGTISNYGLRQASGIGTMLLDDVRVGTSFADVLSNAAPTQPVITTQPQDQIATAGDGVQFSISVTGTTPLAYQWNLNGSPINGETNAALALFGVTTNMSGNQYNVTITNVVGSTNSQMALLTVNPLTSAIRYLQYNVKGNGTTNFTTNSLQVQAIGRELKYLNPDIITFNEIPHTNLFELANWMAAFLPGYFIATNSISDGHIQSAIASRWQITRSRSWLSASNLVNWGYTNLTPPTPTFTRDMFEAEVAVPGFPQPLNVFVTHLKASTGGGQDDEDVRAAEANCVSNFFANVFLNGTNKLHPYILSGDMNEDVNRPATNTYDTRGPIQHMTAPLTGLQLTTPVNPFDNSSSNDMTISIQDTRLSARFDYILPSSLMFSNIASSQVFRTDKLVPLPPTLNSNDDKVASDHLPVLMVFNNPYDKPYSLSAIVRTNSGLSLTWNSIPGQPYHVEQSSNLFNWTTLATNIVATNYSVTFMTNNVPDSIKFFRIYRGW